MQVVLSKEDIVNLLVEQINEENLCVVYSKISPENVEFVCKDGDLENVVISLPGK